MARQPERGSSHLGQHFGYANIFQRHFWNRSLPAFGLWRNDDADRRQHLLGRH